MDSNYVLGPDGELYHWGTKGMKWGIRRYQNKDGSLTPAGKKRYAAENEKLKAREKAIKGREKAVARQAKLDAKKAELDAREAALNSGKTKTVKKPDTDSAKPKSIKDMTDDELRAYTARMVLEKNYLDAERNLASVTPKDVAPQKLKKGRDFLNNVMNDVIAPSVKSAAKDWLEKTLKEKAGLNKKDIDPLKKLKNDVEKAEAEFKNADWKKKLDRLNNKDDTDDGDASYEERNKKETYRKSRADKDSGLEDMQRYRKQLESIYGNGQGQQETIEKLMKEYAKQFNVRYDLND